MLKVTRTNVNNALKQLSFGFIKATVDSYTSKKISSCKGIRAGSIGPMTATTAYQDHNKDVANSIIDTLVNETGLTLVSQTQSLIEFVDKTTTNKPLRVVFDAVLYPTHAHNRYDHSYMTYWWVVRYN